MPTGEDTLPDTETRHFSRTKRTLTNPEGVSSLNHIPAHQQDETRAPRNHL